MQIYRRSNIVPLWPLASWSASSTRRYGEARATAEGGLLLDEPGIVADITMGRSKYPDEMKRKTTPQ